MPVQFASSGQPEPGCPTRSQYSREQAIQRDASEADCCQQERRRIGATSRNRREDASEREGDAGGDHEQKIAHRPVPRDAPQQPNCRPSQDSGLGIRRTRGNAHDRLRRNSLSPLIGSAARKNEPGRGIRRKRARQPNRRITATTRTAGNVTNNAPREPQAECRGCPRDAR